MWIEMMLSFGLWQWNKHLREHSPSQQTPLVWVCLCITIENRNPWKFSSLLNNLIKLLMAPITNQKKIYNLLTWKGFITLTHPYSNDGNQNFKSGKICTTHQELHLLNILLKKWSSLHILFHLLLRLIMKRCYLHLNFL